MRQILDTNALTLFLGVGLSFDYHGRHGGAAAPAQQQGNIGVAVHSEKGGSNRNGNYPSFPQRKTVDTATIRWLNA